jgi:hypothetical protein
MTSARPSRKEHTLVIDRQTLQNRLHDLVGVAVATDHEARSVASSFHSSTCPGVEETNVCVRQQRGPALRIGPMRVAPVDHDVTGSERLCKIAAHLFGRITVRDIDKNDAGAREPGGEVLERVRRIPRRFLTLGREPDFVPYAKRG